uniref:Ubc protein n=1 Tax=Solanum lycopersicum TaxID=4081 RepID=V9GZI0_SOLLC|nr:ORF [Solanum lycopersicum]
MRVVKGTAVFNL